MSVYTKRAREIFAPTDAAGSLRSVNNGEVQVWGDEIERGVDGASAGRVDAASWTDLSGIAGDRAGQPAIVYGPDAGAHTDPVTGQSVSNEGMYAWSASPAGWRRVGDVQSELVHASNTGAGTANAVRATVFGPINQNPYKSLITLNFTADNTGPVTVSINGETARQLVTNTGEPIQSGYLRSGMTVLVQIDEDGNYRLFSYGDADAVLAAAEAAQQASADAAERAETAAAGVEFPVSYGLSQSLSMAQRLQAQANIGPVKFEAVSDLVSDTALAYSAASGRVAVSAGKIVEVQGYRYEVAASNSTDYHVQTAGGVKFKIETEYGRLITGVPSGWIGRGAIISTIGADGSRREYQAIRTFQWSSLFAAVYKADPDLVVLSEIMTRFGSAPIPSGYPAPPFGVSLAGEKIVTSLDGPGAYRKAYAPEPAPGWVFYCDNTVADNAGDGKSWATAKKTMTGTGSIEALINSGGNPSQLPVRVYVKGGQALGRRSGIRDSTTWKPAFSLIAVGEPVILGNIYEVNDAPSWTQNGTHSHVYQASTSGDMSEPGRVFDRSIRRTVVHPQSGREWVVPGEYQPMTSLSAVADTPGSYWHDAANNLFYLHCIGGQSPALVEEIIILRKSDVLIQGDHAYFENVLFMGGVRANMIGLKAYFSQCLTIGSENNGWAWEGPDEGGSFECLSIDPLRDCFNYHTKTVNITNITQANAAVVTTSSAHNLRTGTKVKFHLISQSAPVGMPEILGQVGAVTVISTTSFSVDIDTSGYSPYVPPPSGGHGMKAGPAKAEFHEIRPYATGAGFRSGSASGESDQSTTAHEYCTVWTVDPYFEQSFRDNLTDIQESTRIVWGGYLGSPRSGGADSQWQVESSGTARVALFRVRWGGVWNVSTSGLFRGAGSSPVLIDGTDLPMDADGWRGVIPWD